jgi:hypothetical protein
MTHHRHRPNNYQIITRALEMLRFGILTNDLPDRLIDEFGLTPERAHELAAEAIRLHKKSGMRTKLDTRSFGKRR